MQISQSNVNTAMKKYLFSRHLVNLESITIKDVISIKENRRCALLGGIPFVDSKGKPFFIEETPPVLSVRYVLTRPKTKTIKKKDAPKYISSHEEILQLLGGGKQLP